MSVLPCGRGLSRRGLTLVMWVGMAGVLFAMRLPAVRAQSLDASTPAATASRPSQPSSRPTRQSSETPPELLQRALQLYVSGDYAQAARLLRPLVEQRTLPDRADHLEALRSYGIALYLIGSRAGAERSFRELVRLEPRSRLDPRFVRPEVVAFFNQVKRRYRLEMDAVVDRSAPQGSALANLLPPWGQFQNGHRLKGWLVGAGLLTFVSTSIVTAVILNSWEDDSGQFGDRESAAEALIVTNRVAFGAAVAVAVYGIVDGLYHYFRARKARLQRSTSLRPGSVARPNPSPPGLIWRF